MIINPYSFGIPLDEDAQAFLTASGITDSTITTAINDLVKDMKTYSIWTKMKAIYPMVGGTSSTHKWNLKDPRDLDEAFRLSFNGGWTHSSNGALPNGVNGYADTFVNPLNNLSLNSTHLSLYSRTNKIESSIDFGCISASTSTFLNWDYGNISTGFRGINSAQSTRTPLSTTNTFLIASRIVSNNEMYMSNGVKFNDYPANSNTLTNLKIYLGARNSQGIAATFANKQYAFASIGDGLTETESANLYTSVQKFQTTLLRNN